MSSSEKKRKNTKLWRIRSMYLKELNLIKNDKYALLLIFALPGMIMGTMYLAIEQGNFSGFGGGGAATGKSDTAIELGVIDIDPTTTFPGQDLSENFTWYLSQNPEFIVTIYETEDDALQALYFDAIDAYALIPYGFEGNITGDIPALVEIHISSTNFDSQAAVFSAFSDSVADFRLDHGWVKGEIVLNNVREFEPVGNYNAATFGVFLLVFAVFIAVAATAAQAIVGDVPLNRMLLTPATKMEAILAKILGYFTMGMLQAVILLQSWKLLFGIQPNTDDFTLLYILALMSLSGAALGVFISTLCKTRLQANQSFLFLLFGSFIIGTGFMDVGIIDQFWPLNLGRIMVIDTAFKGVTIWNFTDEMMRIAIFSLIMIILAWIVFKSRKTLA